MKNVFGIKQFTLNKFKLVGEIDCNTTYNCVCGPKTGDKQIKKKLFWPKLAVSRQKQVVPHSVTIRNRRRLFTDDLKRWWQDLLEEGGANVTITAAPESTFGCNTCYKYARNISSTTCCIESIRFFILILPLVWEHCGNLEAQVRYLHSAIAAVKEDKGLGQCYSKDSE